MSECWRKHVFVSISSPRAGWSLGPSASHRSPHPRSAPWFSKCRASLGGCCLLFGLGRRGGSLERGPSGPIGERPCGPCCSTVRIRRTLERHPGGLGKTWATALLSCVLPDEPLGGGQCLAGAGVEVHDRDAPPAGRHHTHDSEGCSVDPQVIP